MSVYETSITNPKKQLEFYKDLSEQLQQENQELKKQLEAKGTQQKEFIELLKNEIEALEFCDNEFILSNHKKEVKAYKEILLKYKEIIDTNINVDERGDDKKWKQEHIK